MDVNDFRIININTGSKNQPLVDGFYHIRKAIRAWTVYDQDFGFTVPEKHDVIFLISTTCNTVDLLQALIGTDIPD